jgi:hypothetical protein
MIVIPATEGIYGTGCIIGKLTGRRGAPFGLGQRVRGGSLLELWSLTLTPQMFK